MGATLFVISNKLDHNRFLCTFRRGFKGAVLRNRVRRLSKEVYRLNKCMLKQGFDVVLLVSASDSDFCVLKERMFALFRMARLFISEAS